MPPHSPDLIIKEQYRVQKQWNFVNSQLKQRYAYFETPSSLLASSKEKNEVQNCEEEKCVYKIYFYQKKKTNFLLEILNGTLVQNFFLLIISLQTRRPIRCPTYQSISLSSSTLIPSSTELLFAAPCQPKSFVASLDCAYRKNHFAVPQKRCMQSYR